MRHESDVRDEYLDWLKDIIYLDDNTSRYTSLLDHLFCREFKWSVDHDENRSADGITLRYDFADERGYDNNFWEAPCSILEMMIALSIRCQDELYNPEAGYRIGEWFWGMVWNMGLQEFDDEHFNADRIDILVDRFVERRYSRNGKGGLFKIHNPVLDMRQAEIWYQMNAWLEENFEI